MITAISRLYFNLCGFLRTAYNRSLKFSNFLVAHYSKSSNFQALTALLTVGSLICFVVVMGSNYFYMFPSFEELVETNGNGDNSSSSSKSSDSLGKKCNVFDGKWVVDESYPLYNASEYPFIEWGFNYLANGRKDKEYLKWRWNPTSCEIPRFDVQAVLKFLRGKRVVFVGDSLSRTQCESMVCMLMSGVEDKRFVYEVNGNEITKQVRHLSVWFDSFGFAVEFYNSVFLVQSGPSPKHSPKRVKTVLMLDRVDDVSREWIDSDVLVFCN